jgi:hypothetical protein
MRKLAQHALSAVALVAPLTVLTSGCPTNGGPIDANFVAPDAAIVFPDAPQGGNPCDAEELHVIDTATLGTPTELMLDTTMTNTRPLDLGLACGNAQARRWAAEEIIEYRVPGTGPVGISFSTQNMGTDASFNTVVQVRTACGTIPTQTFPPTCFDDVSQTEFRSVGGAQVMGGDTIYLVVTGHAEPEPITETVDSGRVRVVIEANANTAPTLTSARATIVGNNTRIDAVGTDADANIVGFTFGLSTTAGRVDFNGDGVGNAADIFFFEFDTTTGTAPAWEGTTSIPGSAEQGIAAFCGQDGVNCDFVYLTAFDESYAVSAELRVPLLEPTIVGLGETCDADNVCGAGLVCGGDPAVCSPSPAALTACGMATLIEVPAPTTMTTSANVMSSVTAGSPGTFSAPAMCAPMSANGVERLFRVDVPAGTFDLTFTTNLAGTGTTDTVLYVRGACADPGDNLGCQDDIAAMMTRSTVEVRNVTEGDYYAFVESFNGAAGPVQIQASLRPVLASGAACDPAGVQNRCAMGACTAMLCP